MRTSTPTNFHRAPVGADYISARGSRNSEGASPGAYTMRPYRHAPSLFVGAGFIPARAGCVRRKSCKNRSCPNTSPSRFARHLPSRGGFWTHRFSNFSLCFNRRDFVKNFSTGTVHCGMFPVEIPAPFCGLFSPVERSKFVHKGVWRRSPCNSWLRATFPHKIVLLLLLLHISSLSIREKDCKCADLPGGCGKPGGTKEAHL